MQMYRSRIAVWIFILMPALSACLAEGAAKVGYALQENWAWFGADGAALAEHLVATYAIGWPLTGEMRAQFPQPKPAQSADDLGVVVSFACEAEGVTETFIVPEGTRALSINLLNWRTDSAPAAKEENLGARFTDYSGSIVHDAGALCGAYCRGAKCFILHGAKTLILFASPKPANFAGLEAQICR